MILGGNPAYTAPADLDLGAKIKNVANTVYLGFDENETAARFEVDHPGSALPRKLERRTRARRHGVDHPADD